MPADGKYSDEEARNILDRALRAEPDRGVSHAELLAIASEVGVSRESIDAAARQLRLERESQQGRELVLRRRRRHFASHAFAFALVNACLFAINYFTTPGEWWALFPVVGWGIALIFHARFALSRDVSSRALLKAQRRAAHQERYDDLAEQMELAAVAELMPRAKEANSPAPRARIAATQSASTPDAEPEPRPEQETATTEMERRRE